MKATGDTGWWAIFASAMLVVVVAEIGCLARTSVLAARYGQPWVVFAGTMVGTAITMGAPGARPPPLSAPRPKRGSPASWARSCTSACPR